MSSFMDLLLSLKKKELCLYITDSSKVSLWVKRDRIEEIKKQIQELYDKEDVTSDLFKSLENEYRTLTSLNHAYEEVLILDKFNREYLLLRLKQYRRESRELENEIIEELSSYKKNDQIKNYPHAVDFFMDSFHKKYRDSMVIRYKYNQIRFFLNHHYKNYPDVATTLLFYPPLPLI